MENRKTYPMSEESLWYVLVALGKGDPDAGRDLLLSLARRVRYARDVHPRFGGLDSVLAEVGELREDCEFPARAREEAVDVMATCVRLINREEDPQ